ncbi:MAG TPA: methylmalonyl Co-A mutase-associated GTPase MeaB [Ktedonobacterales bacterium]|nr:methylmalonyl Co-A mutase-associated GTPase MeaB [Ktedonobacterales bacterium]
MTRTTEQAPASSLSPAMPTTSSTTPTAPTTQAPQTALPTQPDIVARLLAGDRRALARMVTLIENGAPDVRRMLAQLHTHGGRAHIVGFTGSPGAGKSTLVMQLARELRRREQRIAIIAVDPSSPFTGGAILGDRIRMQELAGDPNVFIRSMASRGSLGGLAVATRDAVRALDAAGFDTVIIETVGAGQAEVEIVRAAQTVVVVTVPGMGDDIQAIKAGILEIADIFVVNKADRPGADQTAAELRMLLSLDEHRQERAWRTPILKTNATKGEGVAALADQLAAHLAALRESGQLASRSGRQAQSEMLALLHQALMERIAATIAPAEWDRLVADIVERRADPYSVADALTRRLGLAPASPD